MSTPATSIIEAAPAGASELFALTDEQILDIQPDSPDVAQVAQEIVPVQQRAFQAASSPTEHGPRSTEHAPPVAQTILSAPNVSSSPDQSAQAGLPVLPEPPPWLATQMNDPQSGAEARDLWNGVQQARNEAAAYREVFARPEEARAAADRARSLEEIDAAFFGGAGKSAEQISAGRSALAQRMLREDPAAFREMVFAGLRALESAAQNPASSNSPAAAPNVVQRFSAASSSMSQAGLKPGTAQPAPAMTEAQHAQLAAYSTFEKSANEDLERSVGSAIQGSLEQALPNISRTERSFPVGAQHAAPQSAGSLQSRLASAIRDNVESALKSDQQLGEQLARVLSSRRFDETTRSQVVRLINDRAQQLIPSASRRIIQEWTQTTLAAHRGTTDPVGAQHVHRELRRAAPQLGTTQTHSSPASGSSTQARAANSHAAASRVSVKTAAADRAERDAGLTARTTTRPHGRPVDYTRLSDEQILEL